MCPRSDQRVGPAPPRLGHPFVKLVPWWVYENCGVVLLPSRKGFTASDQFPDVRAGLVETACCRDAQPISGG